MAFRSILFANKIVKLNPEEPDFFGDLNFNQIVASIMVEKEEYVLTPYFYTPLKDADTVKYRQEVMRDLENQRLLRNIEEFADSMISVRKHLANLEKNIHQQQKDWWLLDTIDIYTTAVTRLEHTLSIKTVKSRGLKELKKYLEQYVSSQYFRSLVTEVQQLKKELEAIRYKILIQGARVEVQPYADEPDYSTELKAIFERFSLGSAREYEYSFRDSLTMNHVEEWILGLLARLYESVFSKFRAFCTSNKNFLDQTIVLFDREIQFYIAHLEHIAPLKKAGLKFCYPVISQTSKEEHVSGTFDLALADKMIQEGQTPVVNDFYLKGPERIIVVSGPNQGGKTTFARTFGQLHYLAALGYPIPGTKAQLYLPDKILTHFEREEKMTDLRGKLEDDLVRVHSILENATRHSVIVINEIFTSTTFQDALDLSKKIAKMIMDKDILCVWVTFIEEIALLSKKAVTMSSTVDPKNPAIRTFKIIRRPPSGLAYAISIAEKHDLTYSRIMKRVRK